jgi:hypothetical protein
MTNETRMKSGCRDLRSNRHDEVALQQAADQVIA